MLDGDLASEIVDDIVGEANNEESGAVAGVLDDV